MMAVRGPEPECEPVPSFLLPPPPPLPLPPPEHCLAAAVLQGFAVMLLSMAVSDPSWLQGQAGGHSFVFGPAYVLHLGRNLTRSGSDHLLHQSGTNILILMVTCCYISILLGLAAFLLDFVETRNKRVLGTNITPILHFTTALSTAGAVSLSSYLFTLILRELRLLKTKENFVYFGDSYIFAICSGLISLIAAAVSLYCARRYRRRAYILITNVETEDASTPLLQGENT